MFGHNFGILVMLFYAGEIQIQIAEGWKCNVFFPNKRVTCARADKAAALQYHSQ